MSRLVRIFEDSKDTASFWYLHRCDPTIEKKIDVQRLRAFSSKIKDVRNATFTHIDKKFVSDPQKPYRETGLTKSEVGFAMHSVWRVVSDLWVEQFGRPLTNIQIGQAGLKDLMREALLQASEDDRDGKISEAFRLDGLDGQATRRGEVMAHVSPSQVVAFIERMCPEIADWTEARSRTVNLNSGYSPELSALVRSGDQMPATTDAGRRR